MEAARIFLLYGLPALMVSGAAVLSVLLLRRMKQLSGKVLRTEEELRSATVTWTQSLAAMGKEVESLAEAAKHPSDAGTSAVTRRKVIKMHRLGSSVDQIARTLRLSKGEVMLLLKVHTIILRPFTQPAEDAEVAVMEQKP